ncbi:polymeric immunoglobulin receptor-like [Fundulus heteroclitus]|uniref:polymeric immunoglobulin receptor-like n=1 Tax=Fundulus heteroclitus TaxID=8078 RepID=UPI00165A870C|nr:polymeric immunoglobulin receptor-like [Fundulus heteroclitus]
MTVLQSFFIFFLLSLQVRGSRAVQALTHYGESGGNFSSPCPFLSFGTLKIFCRENCEGENLLIRTNEKTAQNGRYRTEYVREASRTYSVLSVSISGLNRSDSGLYRCGLGDSSSSASYQDFRLVVVDALLDGNKDHVYKEAGSSLTVACSFGSSGGTKSFCRGGPGEEEVLVQTGGDRGEKGRYTLEYDKQPSGGVLLVTITQLTQSDSGRYRCKMDRKFLPDLYRDFRINVTNAVFKSFSSSPASVFSKITDPTLMNTTASEGFSSKTSEEVLLVVLILTFAFILFSVVLLVFCRKKICKPKKGTKTGGSDKSDQQSDAYENYPSGDLIYRNFKPVNKNKK